MVDREIIADLLGKIERYNPGNLGIFVEYLRETTKRGTYDLEAYLPILKLYQFKHAQFDLETTRAILLKAITAMPNNDFSLCLGLLTLEQQDHPQIQPLVYMADLLETCNFNEFWAYLEENPELMDVKFLVEEEADGSPAEYETIRVTHFVESIRNYVAHVINITYQNVDKKLVSEMIGSPSAQELENFIEMQGWVSVDDNTVFVVKQEELVTSKEISENIQLKSLIPLIAASLQA